RPGKRDSLMSSSFSPVPGATPVKDIDGRERTEEDYRALEEALLAAEDAALSANAEADDRRIDDIAAQLEEKDQQRLEADWLERAEHHAGAPSIEKKASPRSDLDDEIPF